MNAAGAAAAGAAPAGAVDEAVAMQAAEWFFLLQSGQASEADRRRCTRWCQAHPSHALAWERAQQVGRAFAELPSAVAVPVLGRPAKLRRRAAVRMLAVMLTAGPAGWLAWRHAQGTGWTADHRTATGERSRLVLADGSRLQLDTASAVDIAFDGAQRLIHLRAGAIHIETAADPVQPPRPLIVATSAGRLRALGTRFTVRQEGSEVRVAVFEGAVEARPADAPQAVRIIAAGQQARMARTTVLAPEAVQPQDDSWTRGVLHVRGMRLQDFAAELGRYRPGLLRCDPQVGALPVSGVFRLDDTTAVLDSLPQVLPVRVVYRSRYWVVLAPPQG